MSMKGYSRYLSIKSLDPLQLLGVEILKTQRFGGNLYNLEVTPVKDDLDNSPDVRERSQNV